MSFPGFQDYLRQQAELAQHRQRLGEEDAYPARLLPGERLALLLARLQVEAEPVATDGQARPLAEATEAFILHHAGSSGFGLAPEQSEVLRLVDDIFEALAAPDQLIAGFRAALLPLRIVLARLALTEPGGIADPLHPGRALLEFAVRIGRGWDSYAGRRADELPARINETCRRLATLPSLNATACAGALQELTGFFQEFSAATRLTEQRVVEAERHQQRQQDARAYVAHLVGGSLSGRSLPASALAFLAEVWAKYLHTVFLRDGVDSPVWAEAVADIERLAVLFDGPGPEELPRTFAARAFTFLGHIREAVDSIHHNLALSQRLADELERVVLGYLEGRPVALEMAEMPTADAEDVLELSALPASGEALRRVRALRVGDWLSVRENGAPVRCKLADKDLVHGYVLLVNYSGIKVGRRELARLAAEFEAGEAYVLARQPILETCQAFLEARCQERLALAKRGLIQALRAREAERARQMAEELAAEEARQAEERARRDAEARAEAERQAYQRALQEAAAEVRQLQPGSVLDITDEDGRRVTLKLALVMASTRKLVFVNRQGVRQRELTQDELAAFLVEGRASVLQFGVAFENTLQALVQQRRAQLQE